MKKFLSIVVIAISVILGVPAIFFAILGFEGKEGFGLTEGTLLLAAGIILAVACRSIVGKLTPGWPRIMFKS